MISTKLFSKDLQAYLDILKYILTTSDFESKDSSLLLSNYLNQYVQDSDGYVPSYAYKKAMSTRNITNYIHNLYHGHDYVCFYCRILWCSTSSLHPSRRRTCCPIIHPSQTSSLRDRIFPSLFVGMNPISRRISLNLIAFWIHSIQILPMKIKDLESWLVRREIVMWVHMMLRIHIINISNRWSSSQICSLRRTWISIIQAQYVFSDPELILGIGWTHIWSLLVSFHVSIRKCIALFYPLLA